MPMLKKTILVASLAVMFFASVTNPAVAEPRLRLATTTSTENSGLLQVLIPPFEAANHCIVDVIAVGTGKALKLGERGDVDVVMIHARQLEEEFVASGFGIERHDVMYNDFVIIGPAEDPAGITGMTDVTAALRRIATGGFIFISRSDRSGTHFKETALWKAANIETGGTWYREAGRGMGEVIIMTNEQQGYTLADRGTYIAFQDRIELKVLSAGDRRLYNPYGVIAVNPDRHSHVNSELASAFIEYLTSAPGQRRIADFRSGGEAFFFPVADGTSSR